MAAVVFESMLMAVLSGLTSHGQESEFESAPMILVECSGNSQIRVFSAVNFKWIFGLGLIVYKPVKNQEELAAQTLYRNCLAGLISEAISICQTFQRSAHC